MIGGALDDFSSLWAFIQRNKKILVITATIGFVVGAGVALRPPEESREITLLVDASSGPRKVIVLSEEDDKAAFWVRQTTAPTSTPVINNTKVILIMREVARQKKAVGLNKNDIMISYFREPATKEFNGTVPLVKYSLGKNPSEALLNEVNKQIDQIKTKINTNLDESIEMAKNNYKILPATGTWNIVSEKTIILHKDVVTVIVGFTILGLATGLIGSSLKDIRAKQILGKNELYDNDLINAKSLIRISTKSEKEIDESTTLIRQYMHSLPYGSKIVMVSSGEEEQAIGLVEKVHREIEQKNSITMEILKGKEAILPANNGERILLYIVKINNTKRDSLSRLLTMSDIAGYDKIKVILDENPD